MSEKLNQLFYPVSSDVFSCPLPTSLRLDYKTIPNDAWAEGYQAPPMMIGMQDALCNNLI